MPKVKKRAPQKPAAKKPKPKAAPSLFARAGALAQRYALAGAAGAAVLLAGGAAVLWAGGYVGLLADKAGNAARSAAIGAGFRVDRVTLAGRDRTGAADVEAALGPVFGESLLHLDLDAARARVEELGWVRAAAVSRLLPDQLHVSIRERAPAAVWQMSGKLHLIDADGAVIEEIGAYEWSALPLVVGAGAPEAAAGLLQALARHPDIAARTSALMRFGERRWNLRLRDGLDVRLPDEGYDRALDVLAGLQANHKTLDQPLAYIDLRDPDRMVLHKRGEPVKEDQDQP